MKIKTSELIGPEVGGPDQFRTEGGDMRTTDEVPDVSEVERLVREYGACIVHFAPVDDIETLERLNQLVSQKRAALLDAVRAIVAERDALKHDVAPPKEAIGKLLSDAMEIVAANGANSISMPDEYVEVAAWLCGIKPAPQPVGEVKAVEGIPIPTGHAEADRIIGRLMSSDPDFQDCTDAAALIQREICGPDGFATWREAALAERIKRTPQPVGEVPMPEVVEELAVTRYRPVPNGLFGYKVVAGDGSRTIFEGTKRECGAIARKLTEAFLDGAFVGGEQCRDAGYAAGGKDAKRYRFLRGDGGPTSVRWPRWEVTHWTGNWNPVSGKELDAAIDAALRGEVKP